MTTTTPEPDVFCPGSGLLPLGIDRDAAQCANCGTVEPLDRDDNIVDHLPGLPSFIRVGAQVAEYTDGRGHRHDRKAVMAAVSRITRTQVRVTYGHPGDETVYRRHQRASGRVDLTRDVGGTWGTTWALRPCDDPQVVTAIAVAREGRFARQIEALARKWYDGDRSAPAAIAEVLEEADVLFDATVKPPYSNAPIDRRARQ